jgi:hypothetical protein
MTVTVNDKKGDGYEIPQGTKVHNTLKRWEI